MMRIIVSIAAFFLSGCDVFGFSGCELVEQHNPAEKVLSIPGEWKPFAKSPLTPLFQRGEFRDEESPLCPPLEKGSREDLDALYTIDKTVSRSGREALKITKQDAAGTAGWVCRILGLAPGKWYELSCRLKTAGLTLSAEPVQGVNLSLIFFIPGLDPIVSEAPAVLRSEDWRRQRLVFVVPEGAGEVRVVLQLQNMSGTAWWEDIVIAEHPAPTDILQAEKVARAELDAYGGWKKIKGRATGFFHTEHINGRWWIITPEGHGFIVMGVQQFTKEGLPQEWLRLSERRLKEWGVNTVTHNPHLQGFAYDAPVSPSLWGFPSLTQEVAVPAAIDPGDVFHGVIAFPDVFDPRFRQILEEEFKLTAARFRDAPWLLGYFLGNELPWDGYPPRKISLFDMFFALPASRPGKQALVEFLKMRYDGDPGRFNQNWGARIKDFNELAVETKLPAGARMEYCLADISAFLKFTAETYFQTNYAVIKKYDPNHLILGARFRGHDRTPREVLEAIGPYVDIVSFNTYPLTAPLEWLDAGFLLHHKPILITEFSCKAQDSGLPNAMGGGPAFKTQKDRALWYERFVLRLLYSPNVVGQIWYKFDDDPPRTKGENSNCGLVDKDDEPYQDLVDTMQRIHPRIYNLLDKIAAEQAQ